MIDVIIPVYRGLAQTRRCIDSVLASHVATAHELIVIDDASPEPALSAWLATLAAAGRVTLITHAANLGFVATVNEGMALHGERDVVLLNSDTEVADGWLDRLAACAAREANIATVTPFSNNATICSYPGLEPPYALPDAMDVATLDRLFHEENAGSSFAVPTGVGFCLYIRRACLNAVGAFDAAAFGKGYGEEVDFCLRASRAGWQHRLAADVFVFHEGEVSFGNAGSGQREAAQRTVDSRYPEFTTQVRDFVLRDPAAPARERVAARVDSLRTADGLPVASLAGIAPPVLCVVHDAAADSGLAAQTQHAALRESRFALGDCLVVAASELGATIARLAQDTRGPDVIVLAAGASLPPGWDVRLLKALHADPQIGGASPMVAGDPLFAPLPDDIPAPALVELDAAAYNAGDRRYYEAPTLSGCCVAIRHGALAGYAPTSGEPATLAACAASIARHLRRRGLSCVVLDHLCVATARPAPSVVADAVEASAFVRHHPLGQLRRALADACERGLPRACWPGLEHRPVRLHVMHYWGGGVERWVHDLARAEPGAIHLTFASYRIGEDGGQRFELRTSPSDAVPARTWDLAQPFRSTSPGSAEYRRLLREVLGDFCVDSVVISSLIGHSLDALETGKPTLVVMHDLYPACQAINPQFRGVTCQRCTRDDLAACREENPLNRTFVLTPVDDWLALRAGFVERLLRVRPAITVPSAWVAQSLVALEPRLAGLPMAVVPHGIDERPPRLPHPARAPGERRRLAVVGRMSPAKGPELLAAAAAGLAPYADIWLVGEGQASADLARRCNWRHVPGYTPQTLRRVLAEISPHAAILPSVVPETFGYVLSELFNLGVVPLATQLGSFAERVRHGDNGFLFEPDPHHLVALVRTLHDEAQRLPDVAARLAASAPEPTTGAMVAAYRPWLSLAPQPRGRYPVGAGRQTGLSEPYRHLTKAFSEVRAAYEQTDRALGQTQAALASSDLARRHEQSRREAAESRLEAIRAEWDGWMQELRGLRLSRRPWLARQAWSRFRDGRARVAQRMHERGDKDT